MRKLPRDLLPGEILRGARCFDGPARDIRLPKPPPNAEDLITRFWAAQGTGDFARDGFFDGRGATAPGGLTSGLRTLRTEGALGVLSHHGYGSIGLLKGLFAGLVLRAADREWRSSIGTALRRVARDLDEAQGP